MARAIAAMFAARGHPLMLAARNATRLERDVSDLSIRHQVEVTAHECDVTDIANHAAFLDSLGEVPGIVISAVGLLGDVEADAQDPAAIRAIIETNYLGPVALIEAVASRMARKGGKRSIIGIGSVAGDRGRAKNYIYGSAKAGFAAYLSGLRQKYVATDLHIMTVKPGFVRTAMTDGMDLPGALTADADDFAAKVVAAHDRGRMVYYDPKWSVVMGIIRTLPERIFVKTKF